MQIQTCAGPIPRLHHDATLYSIVRIGSSNMYNLIGHLRDISLNTVSSLSRQIGTLGCPLSEK